MVEHERRIVEPTDEAMRGSVLTDPSQDFIERTDRTGTEITDRTHESHDFRDQLEHGKEEAQRIGRSVLDTMKQTWEKISDRTPEFLKEHKSKIALGAGSFVAAKLLSRQRQTSHAKIEIPISKRALKKIQTAPAEIRELVH